MAASYGSDFEAWEIGASIAIALAIQLAAGAMFYATNFANADLPAVDPGQQVPVRVIPVLDEELLPPKLGGGKKSLLPDMWQRAPESVKKEIKEAPPPPEVAAPSTEATDDPREIPDASRPVKSVDDASTEEGADAAPQEGADGGLTEASADSGIETLDTDGGKSGPGGEGDPNGDPDGGLDKFQERQYVGRLIGFFKRGFVVSGIGLPPEEIQKLVASVSCTLDGSGVVQSCTASSSGNAAFDAAVRAQLNSKQGQSVPPPPEDRPDLARTSLSFSMVCSSACN